MTNNITWML